MFSAEVAQRVEDADIEYMVARVDALAALPGNPHGAAVRRAGHATALLVATDPNPVWNNVFAMDEASMDHLGALGEWYDEHGIVFRVDVLPHLATEPLGDALAGAGLVPCGFFSGMFADPADVPRRDSGLTVVEPGLEQFAELYVRGLAYPAEHVATMRDSVLALASVPGVHLRMATADGVPLGVSALWVCNGTAYLATASTLPDGRGRGAQQALIEHRCALAADLGCDLVVAHAAYGSVSQRNLERAGFRIAYTKVLTRRARRGTA